MHVSVFFASLLLVSIHQSTKAQVASSKSFRSPQFRRDDSNHLTDLYRKEESLNVTAAGHLHSPRYPNAYPRNLLLTWRLFSPPNTRIQLEFNSHFCLEEAEHDVCKYDYVEVEDISETSPIIRGRWCGTKAPSHITSKTNVLKVTFKSDNYFVAKPGFKLHYSLLDDSPPITSEKNWEVITHSMAAPLSYASPVTEGPLSAAELDKAISSFSTVAEMLRFLNPESWQEDMDSLYREPGSSHYRPRAYHQDRKSKIDLDRLHEDVKLYSCTPRNYSVNLREELRATSAVFFPRCLLVQRCGGNCACGTDNWNSCTCAAGKTVSKLHEVLKFSPSPGYRKRSRVRWVLEEIHLMHDERCDCVCHNRPPR